jgi:hypothetical protein
MMETIELWNIAGSLFLVVSPPVVIPSFADRSFALFGEVFSTGALRSWPGVAAPAGNHGGDTGRSHRAFDGLDSKSAGMGGSAGPRVALPAVGGGRLRQCNDPMAPRNEGMDRAWPLWGLKGEISP